MVQTAEECRSSENNASNDTFNVKIGRLFTPHSMFEFPEECAFSQLWSKIAEKSISQGNLESNFEVNNELIFALKVPNESLWTRLVWHSLTISSR